MNIKVGMTMIYCITIEKIEVWCGRVSVPEVRPIFLTSYEIDKIMSNLFHQEMYNFISRSLALESIGLPYNGMCIFEVYLWNYNIQPTYDKRD